MKAMRIKKQGKNVKRNEARVKRNEARVDVDRMILIHRKKNEGIDVSERGIRNANDVVEVVIVNDPILLLVAVMTHAVILRNGLERNPRKRGTRNKLYTTS